MKEAAGRYFADLFDLPPEVILDVPRVILVGNLHLTVENHRGIIEYSPTKVVIGVGEGQVEVTGEGLTISHVYRHEVAVVGRVAGVRTT